MAKVKMNQILAIEKGEKGNHQSAFTKLHRLSSSPQLFNGFAKEYQPNDDDGEQFPDEGLLVQAKVSDVLAAAAGSLANLFDVVATKDFGNMTAKADIKIGDQVLVEGVPATFLLFMEKQLNDIKKFITELPTLDPTEEWALDEKVSLYKTGVQKTHRTRKVQKPLTLAPATKEHPAQCQLLTSDEIIGYWHTTKMSSAMPADEKKALLKKVNELTKAVRFAREEANCTEVERLTNVGESLTKFIFG